MLERVGLLLLLLLYAPTLREIWHAWSTQPYAAHGMFVPLVSGWVLWSRRHAFRDCEPRGAGALMLMAAGLALTEVGHLWPSLVAYVVSVVLGAAGLALWFRGNEGLRQAAGPIALLLFMLPLPREAVAAVTLPLQHFVAAATTGLLTLLGIPVFRDGLALQLTTTYLTVDESCNGLRFLLVLLVVTIAFTLAFISTPARRMIVIAAVVPTAILANVVRVTIIAAVAHSSGPRAVVGAPHDYIGRAIWLLALAATLALAIALRRPEERTTPASAG